MHYRYEIRDKLPAIFKDVTSIREFVTQTVPLPESDVLFATIFISKNVNVKTEDHKPKLKKKNMIHQASVRLDTLLGERHSRPFRSNHQERREMRRIQNSGNSHG